MVRITSFAVLGLLAQHFDIVTGQTGGGGPTGFTAAQVAPDFSGLIGQLGGGGGGGGGAPAPAPPPPPPPPPPPAPSICFSGYTEVEVLGDGMKRMDALEVGDAVMTEAGVFSPVKTFGKSLPEEIGQFLRISTSLGDNKPLEITENHMLYVQENNERKLLPAGDVKVGDFLISTDGHANPVSSIEEVHRKGIYAPLTANGDILVNGVQASSYCSPKILAAVLSPEALHYFQHGFVVLSRILSPGLEGGIEGDHSIELLWQNSVKPLYKKLSLPARAVLYLLLTPPAMMVCAVGYSFSAHASFMPLLHLAAAMAGLYLVFKSTRDNKAEETNLKKKEA